MRRKEKMVMTPQRRVLLEELKSSLDHPSADELLERVRRRLPRTSLATVYRNMELMASLGLVRKLKGKRGRAHFDGRMEPHHHMRCALCGRFFDLPHEVEGLSIELPGEICGNKVLDSNLEILVECSLCRGGN